MFSGFPWVLLGYSQTSVLPVAQFASLFGVYGVSLLVASTSAALAAAAAAPARAGTYARIRPALVMFVCRRRRGLGQPAVSPRTS